MDVESKNCSRSRKTWKLLFCLIKLFIFLIGGCKSLFNLIQQDLSMIIVFIENDHTENIDYPKFLKQLNYNI